MDKASARNKTLLYCTIALALFGPAQTLAQEPAPEVYTRHCVACHARMTGGDGSVLYKRKDRLVNDAQALTARVDFCQSQLKLNWASEQIATVSRYLNQHFYRFPAPLSSSSP